MNKEFREIIYRKAFDHFGKGNQITVAIEELSELIKELCKVQRGKMNIEHIVEEIADVEIMIEQLRMIFNSDRDIEKVKAQKIERLECRISGVDNG